MLPEHMPLYAVVPAAGVGKRMGAEIPKQYLPLNGRPILSHTLGRLLDHPRVGQVVVALGEEDGYFDALPESGHPRLKRVPGGRERADSVLSALNQIEDDCAWVMVHDAARPCLSHADIDRLLAQSGDQGGILAAPVRDTMKRAGADGTIDHTVARQGLWHALTPQLFPVAALRDALTRGLADGAEITDEASAMERLGWRPALVEGSPANIKVTHPDDLRIAGLLIKE
ncbi:2-C-methyl-D-erythritol 4-phosphate cytidylyltransferase [Ferrimonas sediminicola]|uniref:2-C-methyl-D-erythritol 4-phosphate cytidylyltransferase n=1 Tax=Ferrimonas sediminicola TaxID=2569538 RepID=A0A4U1BDN4_9GAMM|nr:2-C-methyl-D-erythritol 4-phosphate cytidylyltransferase [Ferrimonas sediminicola]TKB49213.1 2-C-methyl-D-erythritol 4-phosphate cytidylyltransferase [Ferrimonas sediminicola]